MTELTQEYVRSLFDYHDGELYWKVSNSNYVKIGDRAGSSHNKGYRTIGIDGKQYLEHRLIFLWHHDYLPEFLDHIDGDKSNNSIDNLREATNQENHWNMKKSKSYNGKPTLSKFKGVSWVERDKKWRSYIMIGGKQKSLGYYDIEIEAAIAHDVGAIKYHGEFAVTNKSLGLL